MGDPYRTPPPREPARRSFPTHYVAAGVVATTLVTLLALHSHYAKPHAAVIDCATGQVIDDGCIDGVCVAGANACPQMFR